MDLSRADDVHLLESRPDIDHREGERGDHEVEGTTERVRVRILPGRGNHLHIDPRRSCISRQQVAHRARGLDCDDPASLLCERDGEVSRSGPDIEHGSACRWSKECELPLDTGIRAGALRKEPLDVRLLLKETLPLTIAGNRDVTQLPCHPDRIPVDSVAVWIGADRMLLHSLSYSVCSSDRPGSVHRRSNRPSWVSCSVRPGPSSCRRRPPRRQVGFDLEDGCSVEEIRRSRRSRGPLRHPRSTRALLYGTEYGSGVRQAPRSPARFDRNITLFPVERIAAIPEVGSDVPVGPSLIKYRFSGEV